jgi:hypothetical protein
LSPEDLHIPAEQVHLGERLVPLDQQPHDRRGSGGQACTGQLIATTAEASPAGRLDAEEVADEVVRLSAAPVA